MDLCWTTHIYLLALGTYVVGSIHPECSIVLHLQQKEGECKMQMETVASSRANETAGCVTEWDGVSCWPPTSEGNTVSVNCPSLLWKSDAPPALITRRCTRHGWSEPIPPYYRACHFDADEQEEEDIRIERDYFDTLKLIYSIGYGVSLAALLIAVLLFCCLRRLLCTRSYIHLNLFATFILRSLAVFVKDGVLFADTNTDHCTVSTLQCKLAVTFFHFCILSNFSWLLVEGLYLQTLLVFTFSNISSLFWIYVGFGWGIPSVTIVLWAVLKKQTDDEGCWDTLESRLWWIIKTPILFSIFINLVIFLNISRIIVQKTMAPQESPSQTHLHRRLVRSTLLLIPLFGVHYVVFALFPDHVGVGPRLFLELVLGSFQGFIVAVLYCFLNAEVQKEIGRGMRGCWPEANTFVINLPTQEFIP